MLQIYPHAPLKLSSDIGHTFDSPSQRSDALESSMPCKFMLTSFVFGNTQPIVSCPIMVNLFSFARQRHLLGIENFSYKILCKSNEVREQPADKTSAMAAAPRSVMKLS